MNIRSSWVADTLTHISNNIGTPHAATSKFGSLLFQQSLFLELVGDNDVSGHCRSYYSPNPYFVDGGNSTDAGIII
jgi:hypothetical protein